MSQTHKKYLDSVLILCFEETETWSSLLHRWPVLLMNKDRRSLQSLLTLERSLTIGQSRRARTNYFFGVSILKLRSIAECNIQISSSLKRFRLALLNRIILLFFFYSFVLFKFRAPCFSYIVMRWCPEYFKGVCRGQKPAAIRVARISHPPVRSGLTSVI